MQKMIDTHQNLPMLQQHKGVAIETLKLRIDEKDNVMIEGTFYSAKQIGPVAYEVRKKLKNKEYGGISINYHALFERSSETGNYEIVDRILLEGSPVDKPRFANFLIGSAKCSAADTEPDNCGISTAVTVGGGRIVNPTTIMSANPAGAATAPIAEVVPPATAAAVRADAGVDLPAVGAGGGGAATAKMSVPSAAPAAAAAAADDDVKHPAVAQHAGAVSGHPTAEEAAIAELATRIDAAVADQSEADEGPRVSRSCYFESQH
jgi:hypothetical protein